MAVSKRTRFEVLKRDDHACQYCGEQAPHVVLHIDHVIPKSLGGTDKPGNLLTACKDCNAGKGSSTLSDDKVAGLSDRAAHYLLTMKHAATAMRADYDEFGEWHETFDENWSRWSHVSTGDPIPTPEDHKASLFNWWRAGLPVEAMENAINIAMAKPNIAVENVWRYFAGVVWNMFDEYQLSINARGIDGPDVYTRQERDDYGADAWTIGFKAGYKAAGGED